MGMRVKTVVVAATMVLVGAPACNGGDGGGDDDPEADAFIDPGGGDAGSERDASGGGDEEVPDLRDQVVQGQIEGESWEMAVGKAQIREEEVYLALYAHDADQDGPCQINQFNYQDWKVIETMPAEENRQELGGFGEPSVNFNSGTTSRPATRGFIEITSMGESSVEGAMVAKRSEETIVNGHFEVPVCEE